MSVDLHNASNCVCNVPHPSFGVSVPSSSSPSFERFCSHIPSLHISPPCVSRTANLHDPGSPGSMTTPTDGAGGISRAQNGQPASMNLEYKGCRISQKEFHSWSLVNPPLRGPVNPPEEERGEAVDISSCIEIVSGSRGQSNRAAKISPRVMLRGQISSRN